MRLLFYLLILIRSSFAMKKLVIILTTLLFSASSIMGQVGDVNKNVKKDKDNSNNPKSAETSKSSGKDRSSSNCGVCYFFVDLFASTIVAGQKAALENVDIYPERVSFEAFSSFGTGFTNSTNYFQAGMRDNWGIFASDFKNTNLMDQTVNLSTIDWQVIVFRIPLENFKIDWGLGYISVLDISQAYFNSTIGFDLRLPNIGANISSGYQSSARTSLEDTRYKKSFIIRIDYEIYNKNKIHLSPRLEYTYQSYYEETKFSLLSAGLVFRVY
jgi:hypothetical protein